jgi:hypothetical protein
MCWCAYIATSKPLENIVFSNDLPEGEQPPPLHFQEITNSESIDYAYHPLFKGQHLYYVGTDTGCSCGLARSYSRTWDEDGKEVLDYYNDASILAFIAFIKQHAQTEPLELYTIWENDALQKPLDFIQLDVKELTLDNYLLPISRQFYTFFASKPA